MKCLGLLDARAFCAKKDYLWLLLMKSVKSTDRIDRGWRVMEAAVAAARGFGADAFLTCLLSSLSLG